MASLPELCAAISREGVRRNYDVIPEFKIGFSAGHRKMDLVWAIPTAPLDQPALCNTRGWNLVEVFQIEGYDAGDATFDGHNEYFSRTVNPHTNRNVQAHIVLYTSALNRNNYGTNHEEVREEILRLKRKHNVPGSFITIWGGEELDTLFRQVAGGG